MRGSSPEECVENWNSRKFTFTILYSSHRSGRDKGEHPGPMHSSQHYMLWWWIDMLNRE